MRKLSLAAALLALAPLALHAQSTTGPRAGAWGAEVIFPEQSGALLKFLGTSTALVAGAGWQVSHDEFEDAGPFGGTSRSSGSAISVSLGLRRYGGRSALRPVLGAGVMGAASKQSEDYRYRAFGAYTELGAAYFFNPNVSLGASTQLQYLNRKLESLPENTGPTIRGWLLDLTTVRVHGSVYF